MSADFRVGAIVLSTDCSCVALVKRSSSNLWGFPKSSLDGKKHQAAAKHAVRIETGVVLSDPFQDVTFQVCDRTLPACDFAPYELFTFNAESSTSLGRGAAWSEGCFVPGDRHRYQPACSREELQYRSCASWLVPFKTSL